jgi:gliding motility-associated-like protein
MEQYQFSFRNFCDFPPPPSPEFKIPDTICVGECIRTEQTNNRFAHAIEWRLEGSDTEVNVKDSVTFEHCFDRPGLYNLQQTIWFLGVSYTIKQEVTVLDTLRISLEATPEILCDDDMFSLISVKSNRDILGYHWNNGEKERELKTSQTGTYWVEVNDGYCVAKDSVAINSIYEFIDKDSVIILPKDSVICRQNLPYLLTPKSVYSKEFILKDYNIRDSNFLITNSGLYQIMVSLYGCDFLEQHLVTVSKCEAQIYFPNTFSPNDDGINDEFFPQGKNFEPINLSVYDRWGGLLFQTKADYTVWDGRVKGKTVPVGVYIYRFEFINLLNRQFEEINGDVTVLR